MQSDAYMLSLSFPFLLPNWFLSLLILIETLHEHLHIFIAIDTGQDRLLPQHDRVAFRPRRFLIIVPVVGCRKIPFDKIGAFLCRHTTCRCRCHEFLAVHADFPILHRHMLAAVLFQLFLIGIAPCLVVRMV